ncbi:hypothetical protein NMY22_g14406 [Coprinellus aureogranulatus]|nr:hypothetical protein NMY22_g14406 [Coprinellus aureogranulatus]
MDTSEEAASVDHLLAHNHPPSAADLALVLRGINSLQDEISDVKGEIAFWTSRLSKLEGRLDQHLGIASAMRRMPEEILAQVFLAYPFEVRRLDFVGKGLHSSGKVALEPFLDLVH